MGKPDESVPFDPAGPVPRSVAIIMDGNGRWAKARLHRRVFGHRAGIESIRAVLTACADWGVDYLTVYAFSTENWTRPALEIEALMGLLREYLRQETPKLAKDDVRLRAIGDIARLPADIQSLLAESIETLGSNRGVTLTLALSYGSRDEILRAARALVAEVRAGRLEPEAIDEAALARHLDTAGIPDPDLLIRTAGEMRLSNYLLWQLSYAELYVTPTLWPDFDRAAFGAAIADYQGRTRTFGAVVE